MIRTVDDFVEWMETVAPAAWAEPWDHPGLTVGDPRREVESVLFVLDVSMESAREAVQAGCSLIFTHHPLLFDPLHSLDLSSPRGELLSYLLRQDLAVFCAHTNLDVSPRGVNRALAELFSLSDTRAIRLQELPVTKLVFFVPPEDRDPVLRALFAAGAGRYRNYGEAYFSHRGEGSYVSMPGSQPAIGTPGEKSTVSEERIEILVPSGSESRMAELLHHHHPYEEPAFDFLPVRNRSSDTGLGILGTLETPVSLAAFAGQAADRLGARPLRMAGDPERTISRVALCGGSGKSLLEPAARMGADVLVTGDLDYHTALQARDLGICLLDGTHHATERPVLPYLQRLLRKETGMEGVLSKTCHDVFSYQE